MALKRTACDVWQLECQASNVTASVQSDHLSARMHDSSLFFATDVRRRVTSSDGTSHVMRCTCPVVRDRRAGRRWLAVECDRSWRMNDL